jgi:hypothetical protein
MYLYPRAACRAGPCVIWAERRPAAAGLSLPSRTALLRALAASAAGLPGCLAAARPGYRACRLSLRYARLARTRRGVDRPADDPVPAPGAPQTEVLTGREICRRLGVGDRDGYDSTVSRSRRVLFVIPGHHRREELASAWFAVAGAMDQQWPSAACVLPGRRPGCRIEGYHRPGPEELHDSSIAAVRHSAGPKHGEGASRPVDCGARAESIAFYNSCPGHLSVNRPCSAHRCMQGLPGSSPGVRGVRTCYYALTGSGTRFGWGIECIWNRCYRQLRRVWA